MQNKIIMNEGAQEILLDVIDNPRTGKGNVELKQAAQDLIKEIINPQAPKFVRGQSYDKIFFDTTIDKDTLASIFNPVISQQENMIPLFSSIVTFHNPADPSRIRSFDFQLYLGNMFSPSVWSLVGFIKLGEYEDGIMVITCGRDITTVMPYHWYKGLWISEPAVQYLNVDGDLLKNAIWDTFVYVSGSSAVLDNISDFTYILPETIDDSDMNGIVFSPSKLKDLDERCCNIIME